MHYRAWEGILSSAAAGVLFLIARVSSGSPVKTTWPVALLVAAITLATGFGKAGLELLLRRAKAWPNELENLRNILNDCAHDTDIVPRTLSASQWFVKEEEDLGPNSKVHTLTNDLAAIDCKATYLRFVAHNIQGGACYYYYVTTLVHVET